ncbi:MAG: hypothetical protein WB773_23135 [Isosphaeraceae bacterium]
MKWGNVAVLVLFKAARTAAQSVLIVVMLPLVTPAEVTAAARAL